MAWLINAYLHRRIALVWLASGSSIYLPLPERRSSGMAVCYSIEEHVSYDYPVYKTVWVVTWLIDRLTRVVSLSRRGAAVRYPNKEQQRAQLKSVRSTMSIYIYIYMLLRTLLVVSLPWWPASSLPIESLSAFTSSGGPRCLVLQKAILAVMVLSMQY